MNTLFSKNMRSLKTLPQEGGAAMMISILFFIIASVLVVIGISGPAAREYRMTEDAVASRASYFAGESAAEDAYYRSKNSMMLGGSTTLTVGPTSATATISAFDPATTEIAASGNARGSQRAVDLHVGNGTVNFDVDSWAETK